MADALPTTERLRALAMWSEGVSKRARLASTKQHEADVAACIRAVIAVREFLDKYSDALPTVGTLAARIAMQEIADELRAIVGTAKEDGR